MVETLHKELLSTVAACRYSRIKKNWHLCYKKSRRYVVQISADIKNISAVKENQLYELELRMFQINFGPSFSMLVFANERFRPALCKFAWHRPLGQSVIVELYVRRRRSVERGVGRGTQIPAAVYPTYIATYCISHDLERSFFLFRRLLLIPSS